jgi:hypothetical protein
MGSIPLLFDYFTQSHFIKDMDSRGWCLVSMLSSKLKDFNLLITKPFQKGIDPFTISPSLRDKAEGLVRLCELGRKPDFVALKKGIDLLIDLWNVLRDLQPELPETKKDLEIHIFYIF